VTADEIKALRKQLKCTASELAAALAVDRQLITAWERGDGFPTKRHVTKLRALSAAGPEAMAWQPRRREVEAMAKQLLADPELAQIFETLLACVELRQRVARLVAEYDEGK
jgi:transcriptional regulator with XRE-family HTH domain